MKTTLAIVGMLASIHAVLASPINTEQADTTLQKRWYCGTKYCEHPTGNDDCQSWQVGYMACSLLAPHSEGARKECEMCVRINCNDIRCGKWHPGPGDPEEEWLQEHGG